MANTLSNYLSAPRRTSIGTTVRYPSISRAALDVPSQNTRARNLVPGNSLVNDLGTNLLQQQQFTKAAIPSSTFDNGAGSYDPILSQIQALSAQSVANAHTNANNLRNKAAILNGDPQLLQSLGFDANTISAASNNPESLMASLQADYTKRQRDLAEAEQSQNLYYSGEYQNQLANLARGFASAQGSIGQQLRDALSGIDTGVLGSEESARQADLKAQQDAALQASYQNSLDSQASQFQAMIDALNGQIGGLNSRAADQQALIDSLNTPAPVIPPGITIPQTGGGNPIAGGVANPGAAPGGVTTTDPEHNAFVTGQSDVDPFNIDYSSTLAPNDAYSMLNPTNPVDTGGRQLASESLAPAAAPVLPSTLDTGTNPSPGISYVAPELSTTYSPPPPTYNYPPDPTPQPTQADLLTALAAPQNPAPGPDPYTLLLALAAATHQNQAY